MKKVAAYPKASSLVFSIVAALVLLGASCADAQTLSGHWSGTVTQNNPAESFGVDMVLSGTGGSIEYRSLGCGGPLEFLRSDGSIFWYREHITTGVGRCIDGGTIQVSPRGGSLNFVWTGSGVSVTGTIPGSGRIDMPVSAKWSGAWNDGDKAVVQSALGAFKDEGLRNWMATNPQLNRFKGDNFSPITVSGPVLRFKDDFFSDAKTHPAMRENLIAFEGGKVFWNLMKERPVAGGPTLEAWFTAYMDQHQSTIGDMKAAKHQNEDLRSLGDVADAPSQFAHVFRAQALELEKPSTTQARQDWDAVMREFQAHIAPLVQGRQ